MCCVVLPCIFLFFCVLSQFGVTYSARTDSSLLEGLLRLDFRFSPPLAGRDFSFALRAASSLDPLRGPFYVYSRTWLSVSTFPRGTLVRLQVPQGMLFFLGAVFCCVFDVCFMSAVSEVGGGFVPCVCSCGACVCRSLFRAKKATVPPRPGL